MSWFLTIFFLIGFTFSTTSEANHLKKLQPAVVVGKVYCETCFKDGMSKPSHFISGASVGVECKDKTLSKPSFQAQVKTDNQGVFRVQLPFSVSKHIKKIEGCTVKLIRSSEPYCAVASAAVSSSFHLRGRKQGSHIFSAGFFTFKPLNQPNLCNQRPRQFSPNEELAFPSPFQDPSDSGSPSLPGLPFLPPLPQLPPLPSLPGLPGLPGIPGMGIPSLAPIPGKVTESQSNTKTTTRKTEEVAHPDSFFFPPNPLNPPSLLPPNPLNPPSVLPPNPLIPSPPPIIPNPFQPPPAPLTPSLPPLPNLPPVPGLTPPPSPPPPLFPNIPPFPFPPVPLIPGIPPKSSTP